MNEVKPSKPVVGRRKSDSVTLQDVAQRAGVHVMTVSHALKGTGRMTATTRATICRIAAELNYRCCENDLESIWSQVGANEPGASATWLSAVLEPRR